MFYFGVDVLWSRERGALSPFEYLISSISFLPNLVILVLYMTLALVRKRLFHAVAVIALLVFHITEWSQRTIGAV